MKKTLDEIGLNYNSDKSSTFHNYLSLYDKYLSQERFGKNEILEIGILNGDSLNILRDYFENSNIHGIDIEDKKHLISNRIHIYQGNQEDRKFLNMFDSDMFNLIIDDGSHKMSHQQISIGILFTKLKSGGIYIIEDLHTSLLNYFETLQHGHDLFGLLENGKNNTIEFLNNISSNSPINYYLTDHELKYLQNNIESIDIFQTAYRNENNLSITSIIKKKYDI